MGLLKVPTWLLSLPFRINFSRDAGDPDLLAFHGAMKTRFFCALGKTVVGF